jgi:hypothetical protein
MSQATSFSSMCQQLSLSFGVGFGALVLHLVSLHEGLKLVPTDFAVAFVTVAALSTLSVFSFRTLPEDAGSELTGVRRLNAAPTGEVAQPGA